MGKGLDWMTGVALWVTQLPGAVGHIAAFGTGPLLIGTLGMLLICLLRTPLRLAGVVAVALAIVLATATHQPDVLVASDGQAVAVRNAHGRLGVARAGSDSFAVRDWLAADGDTRAVNDPTLGEGVRCDEAGCILPLPDGRLVAFAKTPEAFPEDCRRAAVVVSARVAQRDCAAQLIDRPVWRAQGAITLRRDGNGFVLTPAQPRGTARPWSMHVQQHTPSTTIRRPAPDATPRSEDLEAGE
jgi:competence protein ComEC